MRVPRMRGGEMMDVAESASQLIQINSRPRQLAACCAARAGDRTNLG